MGLSFSEMRIVLEQENICTSLKGRIRYFATRYRKTHDSMGAVAIFVDGEKWLFSSWFEWAKKQTEIVREMREKYGRLYNYFDLIVEKGGFDQFCFYNAFHEYQNQSIEKSITSTDALVRLFAIFDKRIGKRTLEKLLEEVEKQPKWLQPFYCLRMKAENIGNFEVRK